MSLVSYYAVYIRPKQHQPRQINAYSFHLKALFFPLFPLIFHLFPDFPGFFPWYFPGFFAGDFSDF